MITLKRISSNLTRTSAAAALVLTGCIIGATINAEADSPACGTTTDSLVGTYKGFIMPANSVAWVMLVMRADGTADLLGPGLTSVDNRWSVTDQAVEMAVPGNSTLSGTYVLVQGCAGGKTRPETLTGGVKGSAKSLVLHRDA